MSRLPLAAPRELVQSWATAPRAFISGLGRAERKNEVQDAMKRQFANSVWRVSLCFAAMLGWTSSGLAQNPVRLDLTILMDRPTLSLIGGTGTVQLIQCTTGLSTTSDWTELTLLQVQPTNMLWTDVSADARSSRFYRAVSLPTPTDTNLVFIPPGTFVMGSPAEEALRFPDETRHLVTISRGFWMGKYLVTQKDFMSVMGLNPSYFTPTHGSSEDSSRPVEQVTWNDATNYCALLTARDLAAGRIPPHCVYRLPTESEWEYACRAGTTTAFYLGSRLSSGQANFLGRYEYDATAGQINNADGVSLQSTTPVGSYAANGWGIYDMIGNVWEWCQDFYGSYPKESVIDPQGPAQGSDHAVRGGDWGALGRFCRSAQRSGNIPAPTSRRVGFRVVLALRSPT